MLCIVSNDYENHANLEFYLFESSISTDNFYVNLRLVNI